MISRPLFMLFAFAAAVFQLSQQKWIEAAGLFGLGTGLVILHFRPKQRALAWVAFAITGAAMVTSLIVRMRSGS
jgi:hypothetical protein